MRSIDRRSMEVILRCRVCRFCVFTKANEEKKIVRRTTIRDYLLTCSGDENEEQYDGISTGWAAKEQQRKKKEREKWLIKVCSMFIDVSKLCIIFNWEWLLISDFDFGFTSTWFLLVPFSRSGLVVGLWTMEWYSFIRSRNQELHINMIKIGEGIQGMTVWGNWN